MNLKITGVVLAGTLLGALATASYAQDTGTQGGQGQGRQGRGQRGGMRGNRGFGGQNGGGFGGGRGGAFGVGRQRGGQPDRNPMTTHVMELINRADVQNNIHLDLKQKTALTQFQGEAQKMVRDQMQQMFQTMRQQNGGRGGRNGAQNGQDDGQADRNAQRQQMRTQMQAQREAIQTKITTGLNEVLRPDQVTRLHQLDLQWRGVLSLADPKVADEVKVSAEHRSATTTLLTEYQTKSREARQQLFQSMRGNRQQNGGRGNGFGNAAGNVGNATNNGAAGNSNNAQGNPAQNGQNPFAAIERTDAAARKEAEDKALALLSRDEKARWTTAQGAPFTFRTDLQTTQR